MNAASGILAVTLAVLAALAGWRIPVVQQVPIYDSLREVSLAVLAVAGVWLAVFADLSLRSDAKERPNDVSRLSRLFDGLTAVVALSIAVIIAVTLVQIAHPLLRELPADSIILEYRQSIRGLSFGIIGFVFAAQCICMIYMLMPHVEIYRGLKDKMSKAKDSDLREQRGAGSRTPE